LPDCHDWSCFRHCELPLAASEAWREAIHGKLRGFLSSCRRVDTEFAQQLEEKQVTDYLLNKIENVLLNGTQLILNQVFKRVGFDVIDDEILKHLVVARLCQPSSKAETVDYLKSYKVRK